MGITHVTTTVRPLSGGRKGYTDEFLVDTGVIDCLAPADALRKAGIRKEGRDVYELANGQAVEYDYGFARILFMGEETVARIIFGPPEAEPLLGVVALESTGLAVDPNTKSLRRMHAKPLK
ncbi:MAG TPA: hypothetical protein VGQ99_07205 [Tepidisphaeraceae bacterium]|jgi:clan AA aspartic protease|nr:hypothetical protein [Tepidisphaeraceae bacterium]